MIKKTALIIFINLILSSLSFADTEASPRSFVITSENGLYAFRMDPILENFFTRKNGRGIAYQITQEKRSKIWETEGWYSFTVFLSNDGKYLIRINDLPRGGKLSSKGLAIAFYKEGELLGSYSTKDLVKDETKIKRTVSHYRFIKGAPNFVSDYKFQLTTIDNINYIFDIKSGEIISSELAGKTTLNARSSYQVSRAKHKMFKGYELYSWIDDGNWRFALLPGTNRIKTSGEIRSNSPIKGIEELKKQFSTLAKGEMVFWRNYGSAGFWRHYGSKESTYPPRAMVEDLKKFAIELEVELIIFN